MECQDNKATLLSHHAAKECFVVLLEDVSSDEVPGLFLDRLGTHFLITHEKGAKKISLLNAV